MQQRANVSGKPNQNELTNWVGESGKQVNKMKGVSKLNGKVNKASNDFYIQGWSVFDH